MEAFTPQKTVIDGRSCVLCLESGRLIGLSSNKLRNEKFLDKIESVGVFVDNQCEIFFCEKCHRRVTNFCEFRDKSIQNIKLRTRTKRGATTPASRHECKSATKKMKVTTVQKLKESFEGPKKSARKTLRMECDTITTNTTLATKTLENIPTNPTDEKKKKTVTTAEKLEHSFIRMNNRKTLEMKCNKENINEDMSNQTDDLIDLKKIDRRLSEINTKSCTVLQEKSPKSLMTFDLFNAIVQEIFEKVNMLYRILLILCGHDDSTLPDDIPSSLKVTIATMYAMGMHTRNKQSSAVQRVYTCLAIRAHADTQLLARLNKAHITLAADSKQYFIKDMAKYSQEKIVESIATGKDGKLNGDNLDFRVSTHEMRWITNQRIFTCLHQTSHLTG